MHHHDWGSNNSYKNIQKFNDTILSKNKSGTLYLKNMNDINAFKEMYVWLDHDFCASECYLITDDIMCISVLIIVPLF